MTKSDLYREIEFLNRRIAELEASEGARCESDQLLSGIINFLPDATLVIDEKGKVIAWNKAMEVMTGIKAGAILGKGDYEYALPFYGKRRPILIDMALNRKEEDLVRDKYTKLEREGVINLAEAYVPGLSGSKEIHLSATASVLRDRQGNVVGAIECMRDSTERKRLEGELIDSEKKYRDLVDNSPVGIYRMNLGGVMLYANQSLAEICGYDTAAELASSNALASLVSRGDLKSIQKKLKLSGRLDNHEVIISAKQGGKRYVYLSAVFNRDIIAGTVMDITSRKRTEEENKKLQEQLMRAQKMEAIGTLAGGVAHDFNNILMGVQGYAQLMLLNMYPEHPNYARLQKIDEMVTSGAKLTQQLLGFASGGKYEVRPTDINLLLERTLSMFVRTEKDLVLHKRLQEDIWTVAVDQCQIEQVFLNIFINAAQAMPRGGNLCIETMNSFQLEQEAIPLGMPSGRYVLISIADTGMGMDGKTMERIFDPFFTTKTAGRGTGLGLASAHGIIKNHGGFITVRSEPNRGSTFSVFLPAMGEGDKEFVSAEEAPSEILAGWETILVVDDENNVAEVIKDSLESLGYRVFIVGSGQEAIAVYMTKMEKIDLVILDLIMPGISGEKTFELLREINPNVQVIIASGYGSYNQVQQIMDSGCRGFLQKPFNISLLSRKVRQVLDMDREGATAAS
ncbi:MAG: PAS domain S-box protein [Syntrophales bacterium]